MATSSTRGNKIQTHSTLTCPECGHAAELEMPTDACLFFSECEACHVLIRPLPGDCCVFCSYGSAKCPPMQEDQPDCGYACLGGV
ncbi:MAG: GDCCVxC domain-containing (seleno)protein [Polaromonas sp.]